MANKKSAKKHIRSSKRKWLKNRYILGKMRGALKSVRNAIAAGDVEQAKALMPQAAKELDKAAHKNVIHKNKAARLKSRLMRQIETL
ncbi:MAG TPA: 30S ribosomal protein S20 [Thermoflexia bacterium]|nr:30S ribosomal protein S20 [Thermoflexia bacterium]